MLLSFPFAALAYMFRPGTKPPAADKRRDAYREKRRQKNARQRAARRKSRGR